MTVMRFNLDQSTLRRGTKASLLLTRSCHLIQAPHWGSFDRFHDERNYSGHLERIFCVTPGPHEACQCASSDSRGREADAPTFEFGTYGAESLCISSLQRTRPQAVEVSMPSRL